MNSIARLNTALDKVRWLRDAVKPFSQTAHRTLHEVVTILEAEREQAINRRIEAAKQI